MTRRRRKTRISSRLAGIGIVAIAALAICSAAQVRVLIALIILVVFVHYWRRWRVTRAITMAAVDSMVGDDFERYVARLLGHQGYRAEVTRASGDLGVDIVATKGGVRHAIQCKRQSSQVTRRAVSDAVAGQAHYRCQQAMVVTNSHFTPGAVLLAESTGCVLIDREVLGRWILLSQGTDLQASEVREGVAKSSG